jgi:hypothetical protein
MTMMLVTPKLANASFVIRATLYTILEAFSRWIFIVLTWQAGAKFKMFSATLFLGNHHITA